MNPLNHVYQPVARRHVHQRPLQLACLIGILLPLLGPLLDHHYGERQPDHRHLHLGLTGAIAHHQVPDPGHSHESTADPGSLPEGTVSLLATDGWASGRLFTGPLLVDISFHALLAGTANLYRRFLPEEPLSVEAVFLPSLDRPPRS